MKTILIDMPILRTIKDTINRIVTNSIIKSDPISRDKRLTQKPQFELFLNQRPGIKQPEISPTLPLLKYVHDSSPPIKIATMRLRESIFRKGFEWEEKFKCKCTNKNCEKEFEEVLPKCDECGSNVIVPNKREIQRAEEFFKKCNIYDEASMGKRKLLHLLKQIEDDLNIYDDAYIIGIKEYWQDKEGNINLRTLHQILRGNPVMMRIVADELGEPGGRWSTCLRHRDVVEDVQDQQNKKCPKCGRRMYEIHYVSVKDGGDSPEAYYIGEEVIKVSKYSPSSLYGFSPIVTLWQYALTLTNMIDYVYKSYTEAHLPKGVLAMRTSNPDSAVEFWHDVDDKLQKDPHYIPKVFLEGDGNGTGSGMEFVKFMDTLEEMQYIPVRDEIRRTIASIYGVTSIFMGDTNGAGGLNNESQQVYITNMAAESGISIYNDYIMPEILSWLNINDWDYILQSPFESDEQKELNENMTKVQIAGQMLQMGIDVQLGEEDVFDFKYSGSPQQPQNQGFGGGFSQMGGENPVESEQPQENDIEMGIEKAKIYIQNPTQAPKGSKILTGPKGSLYYETTQQRPRQETLEMPQRQRIESILHQATEHYKNILDEYKYSKDVNPAHAMSLQDDLAETRKLIGELNNKYHDLLGGEHEFFHKEDNNGSINININSSGEIDKDICPPGGGGPENICGPKPYMPKLPKLPKPEDEIQKYLGEAQDKELSKEFKDELNKIFNEEIEKIMKGAERLSGEDIKRLTNDVVKAAILKMRKHTYHNIRDIYMSGQNYVAKLTKSAIAFDKTDKMAIHAITTRKTLWDAYSNMEKSLSEKINNVITESYSHPETHSIQNMVKKIQEEADIENYRLERIIRTESHGASSKGREMGFQKSDPEEKNLYKWSVRHDDRTSEICKEIEQQVGNGVPLQKLNEILKEVSKKYNGEKYEYRDWQPHINCRSGLVRSFT